MSSSAHLSDAALRQELMNMGMSVGPITAGDEISVREEVGKLRKVAKKSPAKSAAPAKSAVTKDTGSSNTTTTTKQSTRKAVVRRSTRAKAGASEAEISDSEEPHPAGTEYNNSAAPSNEQRQVQRNRVVADRSGTRTSR